MKHTKASAFVVLQQVGTCLEDLEKGGVRISEKRKSQICQGQITMDGGDTETLAVQIVSNESVRKAIFRLNILQELGLLDFAKKTLIEEGKEVRHGRRLVIGIHFLAYLMIVLFELLVFGCTDVNLSAMETGFFIIMQGLVYEFVLLLLDSTLVNREDVYTEYGIATEDYTDQLMNSVLYPKKDDMMSLYSNETWCHYEDKSDWILRPIHTIILAEYFVRIFNSHRMKLHYNGDHPKNIYHVEYRRLLYGLSDYYREEVPMGNTTHRSQKKKGKGCNHKRKNGPQLYKID